MQRRTVIAPDSFKGTASAAEVAAAIRQPAMMMGFRPILSESAPKITKKGVPIRSAIAIMMLAVLASTFSVCVRKNSA